MGFRLKVHDIDWYLIRFTFIEMLFLRWLLIGQDTIKNLFFVILVARLLMLTKNKIREGLKYIHFWLFALTYIILNGLFLVSPINWLVFRDNIWVLAIPAVIYMYFGYLLECKGDEVKKAFLNWRVFFIVYYIVNYFIILRQDGNTYFLMPAERITNTYYKDHLSGLLGLDGTHRLALFTVFILLLNLYDLKSLPRRKRMIRIVEDLIIMGTSIHVSSLNDNNMLYVLMPLFIILFYLANKGNQRGTWFKITLGILAILFITYNVFTNDYIADLIGGRINKSLINAFSFVQGGNVDDERIMHLIYAFTSCNGFLFGKGFSGMRMRHDETIVAMGYIYRNWGMSDIAPLIAMGGLIFYIAYLALNTITVVPSQNQVSRRARKYIFIIMLIFSFYHQVLSFWTMSIPTCWIICIFYFQIKKMVKAIGQKID